MAVGTSLSEVQKAVYQKLTSDATLMSMVTGVFDIGAVPEGQAFRYITLGDNTTETQDDTLDSLNYDMTFTLGLWSQDRGYKQLQMILAQCNKLLHRKTLTLTSMQSVGVWYLNAVEMPADPTDNITLRLVPRYNTYSTEAL